jgi:hypothetical protein
MTTDLSDMTSHRFDTASHSFDVTLHRSDAASHSSDVTSHRSDAALHSSDVTSHRYGVTSKTSGALLSDREGVPGSAGVPPAQTQKPPVAVSRAQKTNASRDRPHRAGQ